MADTRLEKRFARYRTVEGKAWWRGITALVGDADQQLVVIGPRSDATADDLKDLGQALALWKAEFPQARHIWGLADLLDGQCPRTPPIYLMVPHPVDRFDECYEPVALVHVAEGTNIAVATSDLYERLKEFHSRLAWFEHPDAYSKYQR